jgi:transcriptional regulator with XRE-family HTH domain
MRDLELGRLVRALRRRRRWRQEDCASRAGVHRSTWSRLEGGHVDGMTVGVLRRCLAVLEVRAELKAHWRGAQIERLRDDRHAGLEAAWKDRLERWGWTVVAEVSYSRYGERGRIDLLAWQPRLRILVVIEVKSEIVDVQALLGGLDAKARLGASVARETGLGTPAMVVPMLLVAEGSTNRGRIRGLDSLFSRFERRGRRAASWLRKPAGPVSGLLVFSDLRPVPVTHVKSVGSHRVRRPVANPSVKEGYRARQRAS